MNKCPIDERKLIQLGLYKNCKDYPDMEIYYCPCCDIAFMNVIEQSQNTMVQWRRVDGELKLREQDQHIKSKYGKKVWEVRESNLYRWVNEYIQTRAIAGEYGYGSGTGSYCPNDGSKAKIFEATVIDSGVKIRIIWCIWCKEGNLYCLDKLYGWEKVAKVRKIQEERYEAVELYETGSRMQYSESWIKTINLSGS